MFVFIGVPGPFELLLGIPCLLTFVGLIVLAIMGLRRSFSSPNAFPCPGCGRRIPRFSESCPHCGRPLLPPE